MSDQVYEEPILTFGDRLQCKECKWEGNVCDCSSKNFDTNFDVQNASNGYMGYYCPKCSSNLAVLGALLLPTTEAIVVSPQDTEKQIYHTPIL